MAKLSLSPSLGFTLDRYCVSAGRLGCRDVLFRAFRRRMAQDLHSRARGATVRIVLGIVELFQLRQVGLYDSIRESL